MSLSALFDKKSYRLRAILRGGDLLAAEQVIARSTRQALAQQIDLPLAAVITPGMAALVSGPNGALAPPTGEVDIREYPRSSLYFHLLTQLLAAENVPAAEILLRKESADLNGRHGTSILTRIIESGISPYDKARLVETVLAGGHDRMLLPGTAAFAATVRKLPEVIAVFARHGIKPQVLPPPPPPNDWFFA